MSEHKQSRKKAGPPQNSFYWLRALRITFAATILLLFIAVFIDFTHTAKGGLYAFLGHTQIVPSWQSVLNGALLSGGVLFVVFVVVTLLFGRVYCSFLCPFGILQDVVSRVANKLKKGKAGRYKYAKPVKWVRAAVLVSLALFTLFGMGAFFWTWLDPYSQFGRFMTFFARPSVELANNAVVGSMETPPHWLYSVQVEWPQLGWALLPVSLLLLIVLIMAAGRGRLYCNTICPVGAFLGLLSRFSAFKMTIDKANCFKCAHCMKACKSQCIDLKTSTIDYSRCVNCFDCAYACGNQRVMRYRFTWFKRRPKDEHAVPEKDQQSQDEEKNTAMLPDMSRRGFMGASLVGLWTTAVSCTEKKTNGIVKAPSNPDAISPPGSGSVSEFLAACTGCQLCVAACPGNCLKPSYMEYGLSGVLKPRMNYQAGFCQFHCTECSRVCPTGAIKSLSLEKKKTTVVGKAYLDLNNCIPANHKYDCGACAEHCPVAALEMVEFKQPVVSQGRCSSCGKCAEICPKDAITYTDDDYEFPVIDYEKCIGCGKCVDICGFSALSMEKSKWNVRVPSLTKKYCIGCGGCESICPPVTIKVRGIAVHEEADIKVEDQVVNPNEGTDFPF